MLAPNDLMMGTPAIVSPYIEYSGERDTESIRTYQKKDAKSQNGIAHLNGACPDCNARTPWQLNAEMSSNNR